MESHVIDHYSSDHLTENIIDALQTAGKDPAQLTLKDLSVIDQLHTGGHLATIGLVKKAGIVPGSRILDAGCGIGGSSRLLAEMFGCRVSGIDLADSFINTARFLTRSTGLENNVRFEQGSILELPFPEQCFDAVLCQHTLMNIEDKSSVFKEFSRILKPSGILMLHEVFKSGPDPIDLPVPWASTPDISFLAPWEVVENYLTDSGFECTSVCDASETARLWWLKVKAANETQNARQRILGPHLIFKENGALFGQTMSSNIETRRIRIIEAVCSKSAR